MRRPEVLIGYAPGRGRGRRWPREGRGRGVGRAAIRTGCLLATLAAAVGCGGSAEESPRIPIGEPAERRGWPEGVAARVDSGNAAFRAGEYEVARRLYADATRAGPEVAATWFGLYMAENALGNAAAAESALARSGSMASTARAHHAPSPDSAGS